MKSLLLTLLPLLLTPTFASPEPKLVGPYHSDFDNRCLSKAEVEELSAAYARLIGAFKKDDLKYLSEDWLDFSQSINTFIGDPYAEPPLTFNKDAFAATQAAQVDRPTPLKIVASPVVDCNRFALIWESTFGKVPKPVRGISVIEAKPCKRGNPVMTRWDVEFNSMNWAVNIGGFYCLDLPPQAGGLRKVGNPTCGAGKRRSVFE
jgi:hypothetical protein